MSRTSDFSPDEQIVLAGEIEKVFNTFPFTQRAIIIEGVYDTSLSLEAFEAKKKSVDEWLKLADKIMDFAKKKST